jgi:hypothetical protein
VARRDSPDAASPAPRRELPGLQHQVNRGGIAHQVFGNLLHVIISLDASGFFLSVAA